MRKEAIKTAAGWFKKLLKPKSAGKATLAYKDNTIKSIKPTKGKAGIAKWKKEMDPQAVGYGRAIREHKESKSHKAYEKLKKKIPHDLTYMKGQLKD